MQNKVLVTGSTGYQGGAVVKALVQKGYSVRGLALLNDNAQSLKEAGVEVVTGSFDDLESLHQAFQGVDKVYLSFPLLYDEGKLLQFAQNVVDAWKSSSISILVFNTNSIVYSQKLGIAAFDIKLAIENFFDATKLPYISLRPTLYMDNLSAPFLLPVIQSNGILPYPVPSNKRVAWLSHQDLGKFVVAAFKHPELVGQKFNIGGIQLITGEEMASVISKYAGKPIHFVSLTPDEFESQLSGGFGAETAKEIANFYRFVGKNTEPFEAKDLRTHTLIQLPVNLQTFEDWASQIKWS